MNIISYSTFKRRYNPTVYQVRDGVKGWAVQTVTPTLRHHGWINCIQEFNYGLNSSHNYTGERPKHMAERLVRETYGEKWTQDKQFVYYLYNGTNGYMDVLYVVYKYKDEKPIMED